MFGRATAIENTIHLFADHVRAAADHGFAPRELEERVDDDDPVAGFRSWRRHLGHPTSFAMAWTRA